MLLVLGSVQCHCLSGTFRPWMGHCPEAANSDKGNGHICVAQKNMTLLAWYDFCAPVDDT